MNDSRVTAAFVVFYRSMNLGHPNNPTRVVLETALREAGASFARSFQTNGTVLIEVGDADVREVIDRAAPQLTVASGYNDAAFVRTLDRLATILDRDPFAVARDERTYRETFTFFDGGSEFDSPLPWTNRRGDVEIIEIADGVALSVIRKIGGRAGSPTAELEAMLGTAATTRTAGTIRRLVRAFQ